MLAYAITAAVSFVGGCVARHFIESSFLPLTADAKKIANELMVFKQAVILHLDGMVNKSEIMIRHDAQAFRNLIAVK